MSRRVEASPSMPFGQTSDSFGVRVGPSFAGSKGQVKAETAGGPRGVMCCSLRVGEHAHCHVLGSDWVGVCPTQKGPGYRTRRSARCGNAKVGVIIPSAYFPWGRFSAIQRGIWGSQRLRLLKNRWRSRRFPFIVPMGRTLNRNALRCCWLTDSAIKNACQEPDLRVSSSHQGAKATRTD
jgi:hypothetical protein